MGDINADIFKPQSTGSASSSHARLSGLSLSDILKRGSWSNKTTWEKFYNNSILTFEEKIQKAVANYEGFEGRRMGFWAPLLHCHDNGRIQHLIKTEILGNKIQKLHKFAKWLQCNWEFMNKIEVKI